MLECHTTQRLCFDLALKLIKSHNGLDWKRPLNIIQCHGKDTLLCPRVLQAHVPPGLGHCQGWNSHNFTLVYRALLGLFHFWRQIHLLSQGLTQNVEFAGWAPKLQHPWIHSSPSMSFLSWGALSWTQDSRWAQLCVTRESLRVSRHCYRAEMLKKHKNLPKITKQQMVKAAKEWKTTGAQEKKKIKNSNLGVLQHLQFPLLRPFLLQALDEE